MTSRTLSTTLAVLAGLFVAAAAPGATVVFQAESFVSTSGNGGSGQGFNLVADPAASGLSAITAATQATSEPPANTARYSLAFDTAGTYYLYARFKTDAETQAGSTGSSIGNLSDSLFVPNNEFGTSPADWLSINTLVDVSEPNVYAWANISTWSGHSTSNNGVPYTVAAPGVLDFLIGGREDGLVLDAFVFDTRGSLDGAALDEFLAASLSTPVPEPASALVAALTLGALTARRRRRA